jgi:DNA helicase-2/ATP-dependent DNA helicase PcrA
VSTTEAYLEELNAAQRAAATFGIGNGASPVPPLLIIAGAGSGKTKTLTHRVAHLVLNGADPRRILLMTFARRMAAEMTRRVEHICAHALKGHAAFAADAITWSGTFHAIGARLLRQHAESIGLAPSFSILDRADAEDLLDWVRDELGFSATRNRFPKKSTCLAIYSHVINAQSTVKQTLQRTFPWCSEWEEALTRLFAGYVQAKQAQNVLDYDDLLLYWAKMMAVPDLAPYVASRFDHVLVDEYQDTNPLQAAILLGLKPDGAGLTVVGDDAQSIYAFRAATVRNILRSSGGGVQTGTKLPFDCAHPGGLQLRHQPCDGRLCEDPVFNRPQRRQAGTGDDAGRSGTGGARDRARAGEPRSRHGTAAAGGADACRPSFGPARNRTDAA